MRKRRFPSLVLLTVVLALGAVVFAACGGDGDEEAAPPAETEPAETEPAETEPAETEPAETAPAETEPADTGAAEGGGAEGDAANGAAVFESAGCGSCHTLEAAGTSGTVGPNLDDLAPDFDTAVEQVTNGGGAMPAFADTLSEQEIRDVAAFVVESTSS